MIDLSPQLAAVDRNPEPTGTRRTHYSASKDGPFACMHCTWFSAQNPDQGEPEPHLSLVKHGRCDHPEVLLDDEIPWGDNEQTYKVVENLGCCEEERKRQMQTVDLTELLAEETPNRIVKWHGITLAIEQEAGEMRYDRKLPAAYGHIPGVCGLDGMALDCFLGTSPSDTVYIIRMATEKATGDEDKCFLNFNGIGEARTAFDSYYGYSIPSGGNRVISVREMTIDDFTYWIDLQRGVRLSEDVKGKPIAVDFDGTVAKRREDDPDFSIDDEGGPPIKKTIKLIKALQKLGLDPYILTARTDLDTIRDWFKKEEPDLKLDIGNKKKPGTLAVVDDRAVDAEKHGYRGMMRRVLEKVALSESSSLPIMLVGPNLDSENLYGFTISWRTN